MNFRTLGVVILASGLALSLPVAQAHANGGSTTSHTAYGNSFSVPGANGFSGGFGYPNYALYQLKFLKIFLGSRTCGKFGFGGHGRPDYCHDHHHRHHHRGDHGHGFGHNKGHGSDGDYGWSDFSL